MNRRNFMKGLSFAAASLLLSNKAMAAPVNFNEVVFDEDVYNANNAQTIMLFLYGGPSELAGNLTNIEDIKLESQSNYYNYFSNRITPTQNNFWQEAGGSIMEEMIASGDMNIFRTCYSKLRDDEGNRSHGLCVSQNQRGLHNNNATNGIFANIANTLYQNGMVNENTKLPFLSMEGDSTFFNAEDFILKSYLKPTSFSSSLDNTYERKSLNSWYYYNRDERAQDNYSSNLPVIDADMDALAQSINSEGKIKDGFSKRVELDAFISSLKSVAIPDGIEYPNNTIAKRLGNAIKILSNNADTKMISLGSGGLGGWDDHSDALDYRTRMNDLFETLKVALEHIKAEGKENNINIMVWGDFGRNVNLNSSLGWDHGNLQNFYLFGGKNYFNYVGVVGETKLEKTGEINRLFLKPKDDSYWFEPYSIAATLYKIYGIQNPEYLTGGFKPIEAGLLS